MKYGIAQFKKDFPNDNACLDFIFSTLHSKECSCGGNYSLIKGRKQYQCSKCRFQIAPTANTIFHKSSTPLTLWFHAIFVFCHAKSGLSAKELERQLGVTYKTAWRMLKKIREALKQDDDKLDGLVEIDAAFFGGRKDAGKDNENLSKAMAQKGVVIAGITKNKMKAKVVDRATGKNHIDFIKKNIKKSAILLTDNSVVYSGLKGYHRHAINHKDGYVENGLHINGVEGFWSHAKRSIKGTHKVISKKYLQSYLDGFVFHYNNRHNDKGRFSSLLGALLSYGV